MARFWMVLRGALVWSGATALAVAVASALRPHLRPGTTTFESVLVGVAAAVLMVCAAWAWAAITAAVVETVACRPGRAPGVPEPLRRVVSLACGVALAGALAPAGATPGPVHSPADDRPVTSALAGLPFPSRPVDGPAGPAAVASTPAGPASREGVGTVRVVRPGDTLWSIARRLLPPGADAAEVGTAWRAVYARNRDLVGPDPHLIQPGQRLGLPPHLFR